MKNIELPISQKQIIIDALNLLKRKTNLVAEEDQNKYYLLHDIQTLSALLKYKTVIQITEDEEENFSITNGIDLPKYIY